MYLDIFAGAADVIREFEAPAGALDDSIVHFAKYSYEHYSGDAIVIFERDGKLYEVNGSHCSCYGLEGQWEPEETSWAALAMRNSWPEVKELADKFVFLNLDLAQQEALVRAGLWLTPELREIFDKNRAGEL